MSLLIFLLYSLPGCKKTHPNPSQYPPPHTHLLRAVPSSTCTSAAGADVLAYASACQRDSQSDRPTFGRINFCPSHLSADPSEWASQLSTATHELAHALGFSGDGLPLFRYPDGSPRTPRSSYDSTSPADPYFVQYTCPTDGQLYGEYMASSLTVQFFFERGSLPCTWANNGASGSFIPLVDGTTRVSSCVARVVTPIATAAAQWYTGCSTLPGPEFDHTDGACSIYGSHWAARVMGQELMSPLLWHRQLTSPLTLAFFADSGWYGVAWSAVYQPKLGDWMFQQGCALNQGRCTAANVGTNPQHFFTASTPTASQRSGVCTTDREAVAYVTVNQYSAPLSPAFQYFPSTSFAAFGGYAEYDFCPVPIPYSNYVCTTPGVTATSTQRARGESFGASSRCFLSTLSSSSSPTSTAGCYATTCSSSPPFTLTITAAGGGVGVCTTAGSTIGISGYSGSVTCPDPATVCGSSPLPPFSPPAVPNFPITPSPTPTSRPTVNTIKYALLFTAAASTTPFAAAAAQASLLTTLGGGLGKGGVSVTVDSVSLLPAGADTRQRRVELWGAAERDTVAAGGHPLMAWGAGQGEDTEEGTDGGGGGGASSTPTTPTIISKRDALALNRHRVLASSSQGVRVVFSSPTSSLLTALSLPSSSTTMGALSVALGNALSSTTLLASIASTSLTSPTTLGYSAVMMDPTSSIAYFPVTGPQQSWAAPPTPGITPGGGGGGGGSTSTTSFSAYNYALYLYIAIAVIVLFSLVSSLRGWHARRQQQRVLSGMPDAMEMEGGGPRGGGPPPPLLYSGGEIPMATYAAPPPQGYPGSGGGGRGYAPQPYPNYPNAGIYPPPPVGSYVQPPPSSRRGPPGGGRGTVV